MDQEIKRLYDEAREAHTKALAILNEFKGKDISAEKQTEADKLLDEVEAKTEAAKTRERALEADAYLNEPATRKSFFNDNSTPAEVTWQGKKIDAAELAEMKRYSPFPQFLATDEAASKAYAKAFRHYIRMRKEETLTEAEVKALSVGDPQAGGYLVQDTHLTTVLVKSRVVSAMRNICNVLPPVPSGSLITPSEESIFSDATWTTEVLTGAADTVTPFGQKRLTPKPLAKRVKISNTLLRAPIFDAEAYVMERFGYKFGVPEEYAYVNGLGVGGPLGILQTPSLPTYTTAASNVVTGDDIINWIYSLPAAYAAAAKILCNRALLRKVRILKDGLGGYIWQPGLAAGMPNRLLDVPYALSDQFDDGLDANDAWDDSAVIAVIGDFSFYWIVDAIGMTIQRLNELYAETNQTGFIGRKESDGMAVLAEAFYSLTVKA